MEGVGFAIFAVVAVVFGVGLWMLSYSMDQSRITDYIRQRGGRVVSINWAPFGKGWFGEKEERIYEVVYYDRDGNQHFATCKTSIWTGVFWSDDRVTHRKPGWYDSLPEKNEPGKPLIGQIAADAGEDPAEELRRLREENARLRAQVTGIKPVAPAASADRCPACSAAVPPEAERCPECRIALR
jgi:hypothetical protein